MLLYVTHLDDGANYLLFQQVQGYFCNQVLKNNS